jgi:predicted S18 family serine protease
MEEPKRNYMGIILSLSILFNILFVGMVIFIINQQKELQNNFNEITSSVVTLEDELNMTLLEKQYYQKQAEYYYGLLEKNNASEGFNGEASIKIVAVRSVRYGSTGIHEGITLTATLETEPGEGRILVSTDPRIGIDIQTSVTTAISVVEDLTGINLGKTDVILTIKADEENEIIDGSSAGGSLAVALLATITGDDLNGNMYFTGSIEGDGSIGHVAGVTDKAIAAAEEGATHFLVPLGQGTTLIRFKRERTLIPGVTITSYESKKVDLEDYLNEMGYRMKIVEVGDLEEAYSYFTV